MALSLIPQGEHVTDGPGLVCPARQPHEQVIIVKAEGTAVL